MSKFNNRNLLDVEAKIIELNEKKIATNNERSRIQLVLADIKNDIKENKDYKKTEKLYRERTQYLEKLKQCENDRNNIKLEIQKLSILKNEIKLDINNDNFPDISNLMQDLKEIKKYYLDFSADKSRVSSMRIMASEFVNKIDKLIK